MTGTNPLDNETLLEADEQPSNGKWIDTCDITGNATYAEMDAGNDAGMVVKDGFDDAEDDLQPLVARGFMAAAVRTSSDRDRAHTKN